MTVCLTEKDVLGELAMREANSDAKYVTNMVVPEAIAVSMERQKLVGRIRNEKDLNVFRLTDEGWARLVHDNDELRVEAKP